MSSFDETLEKLYLPSRWSTRFSPDEIVEKHLELVNRESDQARQRIPCQLNIPYGPLDKEKIDIFGTDLNNASPIFVFIHGGYWQEVSLKRDTYHFIAANLYKNGFKSIFVGYELCPEVSMSKILEEIGAAALKCRDYAQANNSKGLYFAGYSAGAHLLASLFIESLKCLAADQRNLIRGAFLISGIYDLSAIPRTSVNVALGLDEEGAQKLSPQKQDLAKNITTKFYVIAAANDSPEFVQQSRNFHEKIRRANLESVLVVVDNVDHFDVVELMRNEEYKVTQLIIEQLQK